MADTNAKLQSLFGKNKLKKKKSTTVNANVIVKTSAQNAERAAVAAAEAAAAPKAAASGAPATGKKLSDLSLNRADDDVEKSAFQWAKQPKKYKNLDEKEAVATTWAEREQRQRLNRRIPLDNERAFPSLGADVDGVNASLQKNMKAPVAKAVATKNAWASLHDDEDED
ncbi:unnamed protein product [Hyaloperonospora brassicae]|uniref:Uncharacterized protein n=1 Tax=Hyaloperonospora brassicae TaxID=162125 RepID=A0AAV0UYW4_HYABA|nr:unnamed protein product [Hyaloperonospora brassicae]